MTADELERWTGYADENITKGVKLLIDLGWLIAQSARGPWCLAEGRQLPLMAVELDASTDQKPVRTVSRRIPPKVEPEPDPDVSYETHGVTFEKNMAACFGRIGAPYAGKISRLPWVSPEFIKAHIDSLDPDQSIGLAIRRIENNELPRAWGEEARWIPRPKHSIEQEEEVE